MTLQQWIADMKNMVWMSPQKQDLSAEQSEDSEMPRLTRLKRLSSLLENSIYSKNEQQQICMFYSSLIDSYPSSKSTKIHPQFLYQPDVYIPLVSFRTLLKIKTSIVHCDLELTIIFQQNLSNNMPSFYIKNPNYNQYKPRLNCVDSGVFRKQNNYFEAVFGGVKARIPKKFKESWDWSPQSFYKEENIANITKWLHLFILPQFFPFSKRKQPISTEIFIKSNELHDFLEKKVVYRSRTNDLQEPPLLENIQSLNNLSISIQSQINLLKDEIEGMKEFIKGSESFEIEQFKPITKDKKSEIILDAICGIQASKDVENQLQKQFLNGLIPYQEFKQGLLEISNRKFESMNLLNYWKSPQLLW